jgi:hypothetical protein
LAGAFLKRLLQSFLTKDEITMTPGKDVIYAIARVQMTRRYTYYDRPTGGPDVPVDLTGYTARLVVGKLGAAPVVDLSTGNGAISIMPLAGVVDVAFSRAALDVPPGEYHYQLVLTSAGGLDYPLLKDRFVVDAGVAL